MPTAPATCCGSPARRDNERGRTGMVTLELMQAISAAFTADTKAFSVWPRSRPPVSGV